ncbi:MAG: DUF1028 domain-containing protein [Anaerolineales bacterium]|nr:DUF1028 domain-containing protein [Anaerolineales bacterium]
MNWIHEFRSGFEPLKSKFIPAHGTFSIVGLDPEVGEVGVAVASRYFDVGYCVAWLKPGVGAVATQAYLNALLGPMGLQLLEEGVDAPEALLKILAEDDDSERRQVGIVDSTGNSAAFTGKETDPWSGHLTAQNVAVQGNILAGSSVIESMLDTFLSTDGPLSERLLSALESGEAHGGDTRGKQSAALYIARKRGGFRGVDDRLVDLKITDHIEPVAELRRLYNMWRYIYLVPAYSRLSDEEPELSSIFYGHIRGFLHQALEDKIDNSEIYNSLAWHLAINKKFPEETLLAAKMAYDLAPNDANVIDTLAEAHFAAGNHNEAVRLEEEAIRISPDNAFFQEQLAKFRQSA